MRLLFSLALRNALRNSRRSLLTALTILLGVALLTCGMAWTTGTFGGILDKGANLMGPVRVVASEFARKEQLMPLSDNVPDAAPLLELARATPGVTGAWPRIQMPVTMTVGDDIGEHFALVQGAPNEWFDRALDLSGHIVDGHMLAEPDDAVVGTTAAEEVGAHVGDELVLLGQTQDGSISPIKVKVVGISDLGSGPQNRFIYIPLERAQWMADIPDGATEILVYGTTRADAAPIAEALRASIAAKPELARFVVNRWDERPPFSGMTGLIGALQAIAAGVIIFITALGVLNTMLMSVLERTAEIGVMRAMGLRRGATLALFVVEAVGIAVVGGLLGATLGGLVAYYGLELHGINLGNAVNRMPSGLAVDAVVHGDWEPYMFVQSFLLGLVMAVVGGVLPAWRATHIQPVEAMRSRR